MSTTTRRGVLGAIAVAPAIAVAAPATADHTATIQPAAESGRWWRLLARMEQLEAAIETYRRDIEDPAYEAFRAAADLVPHHTTSASYSTWGGDIRALTTANPGDLAAARRFVSSLGHLEEKSGLQDYAAACRELLDANERRDSEVNRLSRVHKVDETASRGERMDELIYKILWKLLTTPAPDRKAALWKFDYLFGGGGGTNTDAWNLENEQVRLAIADVRRFVGMEG